MEANKEVTFADVQAAAKRIRDYVHRTPIATSRTIDDLVSSADTSVSVFVKCENLQKVGAFKIRGATNAVISLLENPENDQDKTTLSVITHSSGNHAQALAHASQKLGVSCQVVMPSNSANVKKDAVRGYGATVTECIPTLQAREDGVKEIMDKVQREGGKIVLVPPYDDVRVIAGQGTVALELLEQAEELGHPLDVLVTPVGGGGLLSGCAIAAKGTDPNIWVVGAEPEAADDAYRSFTSESFVPSINPKTIADGLRTSLGQITFPLILKYVDAIYTVTEVQILCAMKLVYERMKLVIEPSAAVPLAVVLYSQEFRAALIDIAQKRVKDKGKGLNIGVVFSGGNVDLATLSDLFKSIDD